ncbi:FMN-binding negative transcriptional regulator [Phreatobacter stygius]|uniref:FMN-binding negative transcriptional regulator n=1 Tax=Phreatobacter stygius TaxID=1940610 RepID=A0A4D7BDG3_9HYPH|nr:FMN-binding negative transcriptional regulator [Phreatobacter stygius]QCI68930.1 FMN-binding negative transcriptional regulator [Phreatobacter stygius]
MHILRPAFDWGRDGALEFAHARGFGLVAASDAAGPRGSHVPFTLNRDGEAARVRFHVTSGNPLAGLADGRAFLVAVWGPDAYVSNDWYATPDHVSTWLYEAVHLAGPARRLTREANRDHGDALLSTFEERLEPKPPWQLETMAPVKREAMLDGIVVIEMTVETVEGQRKLNQHKSDEDYRAVADRLARADDAGSRDIAARMRRLKPHLVYAVDAGGDPQTRTDQW